MKPSQLAQGIVHAILYLVLIALALYTLFLLKSLVVYLAIAAVVSLVGRPITSFLKNKLKFKAGLAVVSTMTLLLVLIFGILSLFIPLILQQGENLSLLDVNALETKITRLFEEISSYFNWNNTNWKAWLLEKDWMNTLNLTAVPEFLNALLGWVSGFTIALFSIPSDFRNTQKKTINAKTTKTCFSSPRRGPNCSNCCAITSSSVLNTIPVFENKTWVNKK